MKLGGVEIVDTFAEAFECWYSSFVITAASERWARIAATEATGFATSLIGCGAEAGIERVLPPESTPDSRPGCSVMVFAPKKSLPQQLLMRIGQCVLTAPTARVFSNGEGEKVDIGYRLRYFGDGYEEVRSLYGREMVAIPVMMGEFLVERELTMARGVAGGNFIIIATSQKSALEAGELAVNAVAGVEGVITPFPGGLVASGSKVGSRKYSFMKATTNERFCPTLRDRVEDSELPEGAGAVVEVVINGISVEAVRRAMHAGIEAACRAEGVLAISAGNYGGKLGKYHVHLRELF